MNNNFFSSYMGIQSFFQVPIMDPAQIKDGMAVIAGVPIDQGIVTARPGARYGPRGIREASQLFRGAYESASDHTLADVDTRVFRRLNANPNISDIGDFHINPTNTADTTETVIRGVSNIVGRGGFPVVLGGDHYVAYPSFAGFALGMAERKENPRLGYLHIDSHPDFRDDHGTGVGGKFTHGTQARRISENARISYKNMAWVGLNGSVLDPAMFRIFNSEKMKVLSARVIREIGVADVLRDAMEAVAQSADAIYVTVDIDVLDGSVAPGTGAPVFSGINAAEFLQIMQLLGTYDIIGAVDLCEVSPPLDPGGMTTHLAANGILNLLSPLLFETVNIS